MLKTTNTFYFMLLFVEVSALACTFFDNVAMNVKI